MALVMLPASSLKLEQNEGPWLGRLYSLRMCMPCVAFTAALNQEGDKGPAQVVRLQRMATGDCASSVSGADSGAGPRQTCFCC